MWKIKSKQIRKDQTIQALSKMAVQLISQQGDFRGERAYTCGKEYVILKIAKNIKETVPKVAKNKAINYYGSNLDNSLLSINLQNLPPAGSSISQANVDNLLVLGSLTKVWNPSKLVYCFRFHRELHRQKKWIRSTMFTLTLSRITRGPATPETVLYSEKFSRTSYYELYSISVYT